MKSASAACCGWWFQAMCSDLCAACAGMYTYLSYRDPNLMKTIEAYDGTPGFLRSLELDDDTLTKVCAECKLQYLQRFGGQLQ